MALEVDIPAMSIQQQFYAWEFDEFIVGFTLFSVTFLAINDRPISMLAVMLISVGIVRRWKEGN